MTADHLHRSCRVTLESWTSPSAEQEELRRQYCAFLATRPDGWARSCPGTHLTASAMICSPDSAWVLLMLHRKIGRWLQTGGHLEIEDVSCSAAALREAGEESGLRRLELLEGPVWLSRHEVPCGSVRPTFHLDIQYVAVADVGEQPMVSDESDDVRWFATDELPDVDASVLALIAAAQRRLFPEGRC